MGGFGSGKPEQDSARPLVEASQRLTFGDFKRVLDGDEEELMGILQGSHFVMAALRPGAMQIPLFWQNDGVDQEQTIEIRHRPQKNGLRRCLECPQCLRLVGTLLRPSGAPQWQCRRCSKAAYVTNRLSDKAARAIVQRVLAGDAAALQEPRLAAIKASIILELKRLGSRNE